MNDESNVLEQCQYDNGAASSIEENWSGQCFRHRMYMAQTSSLV